MASLLLLNFLQVLHIFNINLLENNSVFDLKITNKFLTYL